MFSPLTKQLIEALQSLPGVGPKSAQRMAFQLLSEHERTKGRALTQALQQALGQVHHCQFCRNFTESELCDICANPKRNQEQLCIVENPADVIALEETHVFRGRYFILHGHLSPLDNIGPSELGLAELFDKIESHGINEVVLATNPTMEGEATAHYIANHLDRINVQCSRLAHGIPMGGELEFLDGNTLSHAFQSRVLMSTEEN